ncbi:hypothetical protein PIROE2DRAFT_4641, partial [Piromyces sp. E2]
EDSQYIGSISEFSFEKCLNLHFHFEFDITKQDKNKIISKIISEPILKYNNFTINYDEGYVDEYCNPNNSENVIFASILFNNMYDYTIDANDEYINFSNSLTGDYGLSRANPSIFYPQYVSYIQAAVDAAIISLNTNSSISYNIDTGYLSKPPINYLLSENGKIKLYSLLLNFIFIVYVPVITRFIVEGKEKKIKNITDLYGFQFSEYLLSWNITYLIIIVIHSVIITTVLFVTDFFVDVNPFLIFLIMVMYGISIYEISFLLSLYLKNKNISGYISFCIITVMCFGYFSSSCLKLIPKLIIVSFCSPITFGIIMEILQHKDHDKLWIYILLLIGNIIHYHVMIKITSILSKMKMMRNSKFSIDEDKLYFFKQNIQKYTNFNSNYFLKVSNISMVYKKKILEEKMKPMTYPFLKKSKKEPFIALRNINFKAYENEIFMIVGAKGSGKSTIFEMLTGLTQVVIGEISFNGVIVSKDNHINYQHIGFCPQWNSFHEELTSQKRQLCLEMAFIGNPKYVFLDEPTVCFDGETKKNIWNFLIRKKEERIIIMTTCNINEAEILGDHILILNKGVIECLGSVDYVKNHFNINYYLEIEKGLSEQTNDILKNYIPGSKIIENTYRKDINKINLNKNIWELPISSITNFKELNRLKKVYDENKNYINHNSLYLPTLEEMYLQMNDKKCDYHELEDNDDYDINNDHNKLIINTNDPVEFPKIYKIRPFHWYSRIFQILILYRYRLVNYLGNKILISYAILFPISVIGIISSLSVISKFLVNYENYSAFSTDIYYNNSENNLPLNSNYHQAKLIWNINPEKTTIPALTNSNFNKILNTSNHTYSYEITSYNDIKLNDIGKSTGDKDEMYFVSSISGTVDQEQYNLNIYYNQSIVYALPITINLISNSVLSYNNITQKIKTSFEGRYEHSFKSNKEYIIFNINSITVFYGITIFCLISVFAKMIVVEHLNKLIHHYHNFI